MLIALGALQEGVITENTTVYCPGYFMYGRRFGCHGGHGSIKVRAAIKHSCNVFFYKTGLKLGHENFIKYAKMFGFGEKTSIDIAGEKDGILPTKKWLTDHNRTVSNLNGRMVNYSIGQGEVSATPLQMAVYTAAIANDGVRYQPHAVRAIINKMTNTVQAISYDSLKIPIEKRYFDVVKRGMYDVVNAGGTAGSARIDGVAVCGKTGTAQNPHGKDHSWFVCFAPLENPQIAMCVYVENAGFGGSVAAPAARKILKQFFYPDSIYKKTEPIAPDSLATLHIAATDSLSGDGRN
jgi:penicillin-binding protein 2